MKENKKEVGLRIHDLRTNKNISMEELAQQIGAGGKSTINTWEKGVTLPRSQYLLKLADYFNVSLDYLKYGSLKNYLIDLLIYDFYSENSITEEQLTNYLKVATNYDRFENGIPFSDISPDKIEDFYKNNEISFIANAISDNYSDISKFLGDTLKYDNDIEILNRMNDWFKSSSNYASTTFLGLSRLMMDGIEKWTPNTLGMENETIEKVKNDKDSLMSSYSDQQILDQIYQSKLADWQLNSLEKLGQLQYEYLAKLDKMKNDENK